MKSPNEDLLSQIIPKSAGAHNSIYRGKDITDLFYSGVLSQQIAAGTFDDVFIGDYIIGQVSGRKYLVADLDYRLKVGSPICNTHHVLMISEKTMGTAKMNDSNITTGGYVGSKMHTDYLATFKAVIQNDFGTSHILSHKELFTNHVTSDKTNNWAWYDCDVDLMNESMVYGHNVWGSAPGYETGIDKSQLSLFRLDPSKIIDLNNEFWWLRVVVASTEFAFVHPNGYASHGVASSSGGVRPAFLLY